MSSTLDEEHWDLLAKTQNLTRNDIAKLHISTIKVAKDYLHLLVQIKNFLALIDFLFTKKSYLYVATDAWVAAIEDNSSTFSMLCMKENVVMIILTIIDSRTQLFLKSCANEENSAKIAVFHLNYSETIAKLLQSEIPTVFIAPNVLAAVNESNKKPATKRSPPTKSESEDEDANHASPPKQKKAKTAATSKKNPETIPDTWKMNYDNNSNLFHKNTATIPKMDGVPICLKWHTMGQCPFGDKCKRKATHKPMTGETK
jgi:hypothetical protein